MPPPTAKPVNILNNLIFATYQFRHLSDKGLSICIAWRSAEFDYTRFCYSQKREIAVERERHRAMGEWEGDMKKQALKIRARLDGSKKWKCENLHCVILVSPPSLSPSLTHSLCHSLSLVTYRALAIRNIFRTYFAIVTATKGGGRHVF